MKVLIVDDNADLRRLISITLSPLDYQVFEAGNAEEAFEIAQSVKPDFVLLDVMMPGASGFELCRRLRDGSVGPPPFLMIVSARGQVSDIAQGVEAGADAYLVKPFSPARLLEILEQPNQFRGYGLEADWRC